MNRRAILLTGTAAVLIVGAGWALTRAPKKARAPWRAAEEGFGDPRLDILAYAVLAPSAHNMQPWRIRLDGDTAFSLFCNFARLLPETDPPNRQTTIGFGCFLELVRLAAAEKGYDANIAYFPEGAAQAVLDDRPIATVELSPNPDAERDPLFSEIISRRTTRLPFDTTRPVSTSDLEKVVSAANANVIAETIDDDAKIETLRKLTSEANRVEWVTPRTRRESVDVMRIGKKEINESPWGLSLEGPMIESLAAFGAITREQMDDETTTAYEQSVSFYDRACETAMAYAVIKTASNTREDQLETGRAWVRMQLAANAAGVSFHPLSQALQEYPEMARHFSRAYETLEAKTGETVQMLSRLGYAKAVPSSPREPLTSKLIVE